MSYTEQAIAYRAAIEMSATYLPDEVALENPTLFAEWSAEGVQYTIGQRIRYGVLLYKCLQDHVSQANWAPDRTPSLWVRVDYPDDPWPEWRQPSGAHDAYAKGAQVSHAGKHWISEMDANTWEPGAPGVTTWTEAV